MNYKLFFSILLIGTLSLWGANPLGSIESAPVARTPSPFSMVNWNPTPEEELRAVMQASHSALLEASPANKATLQELKTYWTTIAGLTGEDAETYAASFLATLAKNYEKCGLPPETPGHLCFDIEDLSITTVPQVTRSFVSLAQRMEKIKTREEDPDAIRGDLVTIYETLAHKKFAIAEVDPAKLKSTDNDEFLEHAERVMRVVRQSHHTLGSPVGLAMYKAFHSKSLRDKVVEYKSTATKLGVDGEFAVALYTALGLAAVDPDSTKDPTSPSFALLTDARLVSPSPPSPSLLARAKKASWSTVDWVSSWIGIASGRVRTFSRNEGEDV